VEIVKEVKMLYRDYKSLYSEYKTVYGSYDKNDKTIIVKLPDDVDYTPQEQEKWIEIRISPNNVQWYDNSVLVKLPYRSRYRGWKMWCTRKLVKQQGGTVVLVCKEDFTFRIHKNKKVIMIGAEELAECFGVSFAEQEEPELHVPDALEAVPCEALEELRDAD
jgi:hypothetical protein